MGKIIHNGKVYSSSPQDILELETRMRKLVNDLRTIVDYSVNLTGVVNLAKKIETRGSIEVYLNIMDVGITSYIISGHVESTDTDSTKNLVGIYYNDGTSDLTSWFISPRGDFTKAIDATSHGGISRLRIYASDTYTHSTGDVVEISNFMVRPDFVTDPTFRDKAEPNAVLTEKVNPLYPITRKTIETDVSNCIYYKESDTTITGMYDLSPAVFAASKSYVIAGHIESVTAKSGYTGAVDYRRLASMPLIIRQGSTNIATARISNTKEYSYGTADSNASVTSAAVLRIYSGNTYEDGTNYTSTLQRLMIYEGTVANLSVVKSVVKIHDLRLYADSSSVGTFNITQYTNNNAYTNTIQSYYNSIIINGKHYNILTFERPMSQSTPMYIDLINSTVAYQLSGSTGYYSCIIVDDSGNVCTLDDIIGDRIVDICFARDANNLASNDITKVVMRCDTYIN